MSWSWEDIKQGWSDGWLYLEQEATALYDSIMSEPEAYVEGVDAFVAELDASRINLDRMRAQLPNPPTTPEDQAVVAQYQALKKRYQELAAGFYTDTAPAAQTQTGILPVLIVAGLAVGVTGTAWAVTSYEYATNLREQTELAVKELEARVSASEQGRTLQESTLKLSPPPRSKLAQ